MSCGEIFTWFIFLQNFTQVQCSTSTFSHHHFSTTTLHQIISLATLSLIGLLTFCHSYCVSITSISSTHTHLHSPTTHLDHPPPLHHLPPPVLAHCHLFELMTAYLGSTTYFGSLPPLPLPV